VLVGGLVALVATAADAGSAIGDLLTGDPWRQVFATPSGQALVVRVLAGGGALVLVTARRYGAALLVGLVAAVALPLAGHASSDRAPWPAVALLVAHVVAAVAWAGAVVALLPLLVPARRGQLRAALPAAGAISTAGVLVLLVSGVAQAWRRVPNWSALTGSGYGAALLVKAVLLGGLLLLGVTGWRAARSARSARSPTAGATGQLRRTLPAEVLLLAGALTAAGVLATARPPTAPSAPSVSGTVAPGAPALVLGTTGDGRATLRRHDVPAALGTLGLDLGVTTAAGAPDDVVAVVTGRPAGTVLPSHPIPLQRVASGRFVADAVTLAPAGRWQLTVTLTHADGRRDSLDLATDVR
jgi:putative copper export protein